MGGAADPRDDVDRILSHPLLPWRVTVRDADAALARLSSGDPHVDEPTAWLRDPTRAPSLRAATALGQALDAARDAAADALDGTWRNDAGERFEAAILLGASPAEHLLSRALGPPWGTGLTLLPVHDEDGVARALHRLGRALPRTLVIVREGARAASLVDRVAADALLDAGAHAAPQLLLAVPADHPLRARAVREGWARALDSTVPAAHAGTAPPGVLVAGLAGHDADVLLEGAREADAWRAPSPEGDPAALLGAALAAAGGATVVDAPDRLRDAGSLLAALGVPPGPLRLGLGDRPGDATIHLTRHDARTLGGLVALLERAAAHAMALSPERAGLLP